MRSEVIDSLVNQYCLRFKEALKSVLKENRERLPYASLCVDFMTLLKDKDIEIIDDIFSSEVLGFEFIEEIDKEFTNYLSGIKD